MVSIRFITILFVCTVVVGCGSGPAIGDPATAERRQELDEIYEIYTHYLKAQQAAPKQLSDLTKKTYEGSQPMGVHTLKTGKYIFVFGVAEKSGNVVLAYEKDAPTKGGAVLMADGTVKFLSVDEFKAARNGK